MNIKLNRLGRWSIPSSLLLNFEREGGLGDEDATGMGMTGGTNPNGEVADGDLGFTTNSRGEATLGDTSLDTDASGTDINGYQPDEFEGTVLDATDDWGDYYDFDEVTGKDEDAISFFDDFQATDLVPDALESAWSNAKKGNFVDAFADAGGFLAGVSLVGGVAYSLGYTGISSAAASLVGSTGKLGQAAMGAHTGTEMYNKDKADGRTTNMMSAMTNMTNQPSATTTAGSRGATTGKPTTTAGSIMGGSSDNQAGNTFDPSTMQAKQVEPTKLGRGFVDPKYLDYMNVGIPGGRARG
ncbi:hypothetical protein N9937_01965 [bacterium]|nr:hypothetical protein [bacterium]